MTVHVTNADTSDIIVQFCLGVNVTLSNFIPPDKGKSGSGNWQMLKAYPINNN